MSALDRIKARKVLHVVEYNRNDIEWALDQLEECVRDDWNLAAQKNAAINRADAAEAKLERIAALCDRLDAQAFQPPGVIYTDYIRVILEGGAA